MSDEVDPLEAARAGVEAAIKIYIAVKLGDDWPDDKPYVQAWAAAVEWTNTELSLADRAGREVIVADDQLVSTSLGLGHHLRKRFT
jgi:hypothetical protein